MTKVLIQCQGISKQYEGRTLFDQVDITLHAHESIAFTGHNGTGKSTLIRILAKLTRPTAGTVIHMNNLSIQYIPEHFPKLYMTAYEFIQHMALMDGLSIEEAKICAQHLFATFFMESMQHTQMKHLSKGTLQKVAVIQALLTKPDVLLLDEPLSGQDAASQETFVDRMLILRQQGTAILMSCHEKHLIDQLSDSVYAFHGKQLELVQLHNQKITSYDVMVFIPPPNAPENVFEPSIAVQIIENTEECIKFRIPSYQSQQVLLSLLALGYQLQEMYHEKQ